ncbi:hypothetical protein [Allokutzneria oryzae]|uniref:Uncharacterized protein n=1 Tax=Allokutzneria oryzae TaxID=1378989 RepID=A0ABV5ZVN2_9PSEU
MFRRRRGREAQLFTVDVREPGELGPAEGPAVGHRRSPRSEAVLAALA